MQHDHLCFIPVPFVPICHACKVIAGPEQNAEILSYLDTAGAIETAVRHWHAHGTWPRDLSPTGRQRFADYQEHSIDVNRKHRKIH